MGAPYLPIRCFTSMRAANKGARMKAKDYLLILLLPTLSFPSAKPGFWWTEAIGPPLRGGEGGGCQFVGRRRRGRLPAKLLPSAQGPRLPPASSGLSAQLTTVTIVPAPCPPYAWAVHYQIRKSHAVSYYQEAQWMKTRRESGAIDAASRRWRSGHPEFPGSSGAPLSHR